MDTDIAREISDLRAEFQRDLKAQAELLVISGVGRHEKALIRIDAIEKAAATLEESMSRLPAMIDRESSRLEALFEGQLASLDKAMTLRIDAFAELSATTRLHSKEALETSFIASEKLADSRRTALETQIAKSETSMIKEMDGVKQLIETTSSSFNTQVNTLTERLNRGEGAFRGGSGVVAGLLAIVIAASAVVAIVISLHNPNPTVGADTKRVDDVIQRLDALSVRLNELSQPIVVGPAGTQPAPAPDHPNSLR